MNCSLRIKAIFLAILLTGCYEKVFIQKAEVHGSFPQTPVRIKINGDTTKWGISSIINLPMFSTVYVNNRRHSKVDQEGDYLLTPDTTGNFLELNPDSNIYEYIPPNIFFHNPPIEVGADMDYWLFRWFNLSGGFNFSRDDGISLFTLNYGVTFRINFYDLLGFQLGLNRFFQDFDTKADFVTNKHELTSDGNIFGPQIVKSSIDKKLRRPGVQYILMVHTQKPGNSLNYFLGNEFSLVGFLLHPNGDPLGDLAFGSLNLGVTKRFNKRYRITSGIRFYYFDEGTNRTIDPAVLSKFYSQIRYNIK